MFPTQAALRPFGRAEDMELEFSDDNRPALVTALLARCGAAPDAPLSCDEEFWWAQPVGSRIAALSRLLALSGEGDALSVPLRCVQPSCAEPFEVAVAFSVLTDETISGAPITVILHDARSVVVRRPTGNDLRDWQHMPWESRQEAVSAMLDALVVAGDVAPDDEAALAEVIATHDPLVAFAVSCTCPSCGVEHDLPLDIEGIALAQFDSKQHALLREVHVLASNYGWTEPEILAIAPQRRTRYLRLIEGLR